MLLNLINDLMYLAKSNNMNFTINNEFFDLTKTIQNSFDTLEYFSNKKKIYPKLIMKNEIIEIFKNFYGDK